MNQSVNIMLATLEENTFSPYSQKLLICLLSEGLPKFISESLPPKGPMLLHFQIWNLKINAFVQSNFSDVCL